MEIYLNLMETIKLLSMAGFYAIETIRDRFHPNGLSFFIRVATISVKVWSMTGEDQHHQQKRDHHWNISEVLKLWSQMIMWVAILKAVSVISVSGLFGKITADRKLPKFNRGCLWAHGCGRGRIALSSGMLWFKKMKGKSTVWPIFIYVCYNLFNFKNVTTLNNTALCCQNSHTPY